MDQDNDVRKDAQGSQGVRESPYLQSLDRKLRTKVAPELLLAEVHLTHDQRMVPVLTEPSQPSRANHLPKETSCFVGLRIIAFES